MFQDDGWRFWALFIARGWQFVEVRPIVDASLTVLSPCNRLGWSAGAFKLVRHSQRSGR